MCDFGTEKTPISLTRVAGTRVSGVDSVLLDACKELDFLLGHLLLPLAVGEVEGLVSNARSNQPSEARACECHETEGDNWVEGNLSDDGLGKASGQGNGTKTTSEHAAGEGEEKLNTAALDTELEEAVPIEGSVAVCAAILRSHGRVGAGKGPRNRRGEALLAQGHSGEARHGASGGRERSFRDVDAGEAGGAARGDGGGRARVAQDEGLEGRSHRGARASSVVRGFGARRRGYVRIERVEWRWVGGVVNCRSFRVAGIGVRDLMEGRAEGGRKVGGC